MFFDNDDEVNDSPVSNDGEEGLECIFEESSGAATDYDGGDKAESYESDARDAKGPGAKILGVHCERVVIWDIVLIMLVFLSL